MAIIFVLAFSAIIVKHEKNIELHFDEVTHKLGELKKLIRHPSVSKDYGNVLCMEDLEQRLVWLRRPIRQ